MKDQVLFPKLEVREKGFLQVSDIHTIYWVRSGNPNGKKILVIHGGPGGGSQPSISWLASSSWTSMNNKNFFAFWITRSFPINRMNITYL